MENFIYKLADYLEELELDYPVRVGMNGDGSSIALIPVTGSKIIQEHMNGMADVHLPFEISVKSKDKQQAFDTINQVISHVRKYVVHDFERDRYDLITIDISEKPYINQTAEEIGFFVYTAKISVTLTLY